MLNDKYHIQLSYFSVLAYFHGQADYFVFFCLIFAFENTKRIERNNTAKIHKKKYTATKKANIFSFLEIKKR